MLRLFFITVSLSVILFTSGFASTPLASVPQDTLNIGFVLYTNGTMPGNLNARWTYSNVFTGSGLATGGTGAGFVGHYHVRYFYENGEFSDEYDLVIEKVGDFYSF